MIHATSDPFYNAWLRQLNIMQHCKIMSIGDAAKEEAHRYFEENLLAEVPEKLKSGLHFEELFEVFGGKLAHLSDYVADYVNADGRLNRTRLSQSALRPSELKVFYSSQIVALCTSTFSPESTTHPLCSSARCLTGRSADPSNRLQHLLASRTRRK